MLLASFAQAKHVRQYVLPGCMIYLIQRDTYGSGTVRINSKDLPKAVVGKAV